MVEYDEIEVVIDSYGNRIFCELTQNEENEVDGGIRRFETEGYYNDEDFVIFGDLEIEEICWEEWNSFFITIVILISQET